MVAGEEVDDVEEPPRGEGEPRGEELQERPRDQDGHLHGPRGDRDGTGPGGTDAIRIRYRTGGCGNPTTVPCPRTGGSYCGPNPCGTNIVNTVGQSQMFSKKNET